MLLKWPLVAAAAAVGVVGGGSVAYVAHERANERQLIVQNDTLKSLLADMHSQVETLNQKITDLSQPKPAPPPPQHPKATRTSRAVPKAAPSRHDDPRFKEMQAQLEEQKKQLAGTREDLDKAREELSGRLDSTRDELSTSIAKNHDEVVELQKRGERNFYEFQIDKSKQFQRVGPVRVSLRKADLKHKSFNLSMLVDDNEVQKKNVNLYEPVWLNLGGETVEVVVNRIAKDHIEGYVSEPKYKKTLSAADRD